MIRTLGRAAKNETTRSVLQWAMAVFATVIGGIMVRDFSQWKDNNDQIPVISSQVRALQSAVAVDIPAAIASARDDPFTGSQGRRMEDRLNSRVDRLEADMNKQLDNVHDDIRDLRDDVRSSLPPEQQWRFGEALR